MNIWAFTGNLGRDAEMRYTSGGDAATTATARCAKPYGLALAELSFSVAVKSGYGKNENTSWARCTLWGKRGESLAPYLVKGQLVGVTGELSHSKFTTKDGAEQWNLEVRVNDVTLLGKKDAAPAAAQPAKEAAGIDPYQDDSIPF